jgi:hypothetical protein
MNRQPLSAIRNTGGIERATVRQLREKTDRREKQQNRGHEGKRQHEGDLICRADEHASRRQPHNSAKPQECAEEQGKMSPDRHQTCSSIKPMSERLLQQTIDFQYIRRGWELAGANARMFSNMPGMTRIVCRVMPR